MTHENLSRSIRATFSGPDTGPGWVRVPGLIAVLDGLQGAITIVMEDLWGREHRPGPVPGDIRALARFRLGNAGTGSFQATLELELPGGPQSELSDLQPMAIDRLMSGIEVYARGLRPDLPVEATRRISGLSALMRRGPDALTLEGGIHRRRVVLSAETLATHPAVKESPAMHPVRLTGRLLEVDYRDRSAEVWNAGRLTRIRFRPDQKPLVDAAREQHVVVTGTVAGDAPEGPRTVQLDSIATIPVDDSFWRSLAIPALALEQGVQPVPGPEVLTAPFWDEDDEEDFLATLRRWRQES